jgi:hypothetical protein
VKAAPGIDQGLTDSIVKAVRTWKYRPATKAGKPVASSTTIMCTRADWAKPVNGPLGDFYVAASKHRE